MTPSSPQLHGAISEAIRACYRTPERLMIAFVFDEGRPRRRPRCKRGWRYLVGEKTLEGLRRELSETRNE